MIAEAIYNLLSTYAPIAALVGTRIEPMTTAQGGELPAITYRNFAGDDNTSILGPTCQLFAGTYAIECKAATYLGAHDLAAHVVDRLVGFRWAAAGQRIKWIRRSSDGDDYVPPSDSSNRGTHVVAREFVIQYNVDVPANCVGVG